MEPLELRRLLCGMHVQTEPIVELRPDLIGVEPSYVEIQNLRAVEGRFFNDQENRDSAPVCVLGESAKVNLLGYDPAVGKFVKVNDTWLQVVGVLASQATADADTEGLEVVNRNNLVIAPLNTVMRRFEDNNSWMKDEIDGIYMKVAEGVDSIETAAVVEKCGGKVVGYASILNRSGLENPFDRPYRSLLTLNLETYSAENCPLCRSGSPLDTPGSRFK